MATENGGMVHAPATEDRVMQYVPFASKDPIKLSVSIIKSMVSAKTRSGVTCSDADAMKFMMLCRARALNPFEGDAFLVGYDTKDGPQFSLITAHQAFLKRAEPHPEYDGMESGVIVRDAIGNVIDREGDFTFDDDVILGGWATVHFKNRKYPMKKRLKLSTFQKDNNFWRSNPAGMVVKCSECDALRSSFPTILGGMYSAEEMAPPIPIEPVESRTVTELPVGRSRIGGTRKQPAQEVSKEPTQADPEPLPAPVTPTLQQPTGTLFTEPKSEEKTEPKKETTAADEGAMDDVESGLGDLIDSSVNKAALANVGAKMKQRAEEFGAAWGPYAARLDVAYKNKFRSLTKEKIYDRV